MTETDARPRTLTACLDRAARPALGKSPMPERRGLGVGVRFLDRREKATYFTYEELRKRAERVALGLRAAGLAAGQRVALILPTSPLFYDAFFGTLYAGGVPVPLYPPLRLGRLDAYHRRTATMLKAVDARLILTDRRIHRILGRSVDAARPPLGCRSVDDIAALTGPNSLAAPASREGLSTPENHKGLTKPSPEDLAFIQFSSGTTQAPKPIRLTHRQVLANASRILDQLLSLCPEEEGKWVNAGVSWLPLYHDMGLVGCVIVALLHAGEMTLIPPELFVARPAVWLRALSRYRGTISPAPNFAYALCEERIKDEELEGVNLSRWRVALNGAEPVTLDVLDRFVERFAPWGLPKSALTPVYGLAEAALAVTFSPFGERFRWTRFDRDRLSEAGLAKPVGQDDREGLALISLGAPLPGFSLRIVDDDGQRLEPSVVGRVLVQGPSLMEGYDGRPEETAKVLVDGWLDTGDRGFIFEGDLYLYGRAKDIIIIHGRNHMPQEIEQATDGIPGLRRGCSAAFGVPPERARGDDDGKSESLIVLVERRQNPGALPEGEDSAGDSDMPNDDLAQATSQRITDETSLVAQRVVVLPAGTLPRTSSGKIRRSETRRRYLAGELVPPKAVTKLRLAGEVLRSTLGHLRAKKAGRH